MYSCLKINSLEYDNLFTEIDGIKINYEIKGEGEAVVLLHGWGANITLFANLIELVSKKYKVIALDMPGFGKSSEPPDSWKVSDYSEFVIKFLSSMGVEKATLLGHSFGGRVIIKMATCFELPFEIDKIILVDSAGILPKKSPKQKRKQARYKFCKKILLLPPVKAIFPNALEKFQKKMGSADYASASPTMRKILVSVVNEDLQPLLPKIKQSTLLIWGENDTATPLSDGKLMEELIPDAGLVTIKNAGHYSFLDGQFIFNRVICSFLKIGE